MQIKNEIDRQRKHFFNWATIIIAIITALVILLSSCQQQRLADAEDVPLIPRKTFFSQDPDMSVKISPNGKQIAFLAPYEGVLNVWVQNLDDTRKAFPVTNSKERPIMNYHWSQNNEQILYFRDFSGDENYHIYAIDLKSSEIIDLTPFNDTQARIIRGSKNHPDEIVVAINNRDPSYHDLWIINTRSGERRLLFENTEKFGELFVDHSYQLRMGKKTDGKGGYMIFILDSFDGSWKLFFHFAREDSITSRILEFSFDNQRIFYLDSTNANTAFLYSSTLDPLNLQRKKIFGDEKSDILDVVFDPKTKEPLAAISEFLRRQWSLIDRNIQKDLEYLQNFSHGDLDILDSSSDNTKWIISYSYDNKPAHYYLYNRNKKSLSFLLSSSPELENLPLTTMQPIIITSRDGLPLTSYLSMPRQGPKKNIPLILWVHGGPWARDSWGYHVIHQWLNNRGYAVLSVNFRGSVGQGKDFINAANRQWSKKMHDDLIDAVKWSIDQGIADPQKIAIGGASYGGYATLVGLTFTPEVFACGIDIVGPSNIKTLLESTVSWMESEHDELEHRISNLDDEEFLRSISPLHKADKIKKPLLITHGKNDVRVKEQESLQIVEAMKKNGLPVIYVLFPDEGHAFVKTENDLAFYAIMEAFLAKELGGRFEKIGDDVKNSSAIVVEGKEFIEGL